MSTASTTHDTTCTFCKHQMPANAAKCPSCQEWAQEIKSARNWAWTWSLLGLVPVAIGWAVSVLYPHSAQPALIIYGVLALMFVITGALCIKHCIYYSRRTGNWFWI